MAASLAQPGFTCPLRQSATLAPSYETTAPRNRASRRRIAHGGCCFHPASSRRRCQSSPPCAFSANSNNLSARGVSRNAGPANALLQLTHPSNASAASSQLPRATTPGPSLPRLTARHSGHGREPLFAPLIKISTCRRLGAQVDCTARHLPPRARRRTGWARNTASNNIHGYDDPAIIAGQGTMGLEDSGAGP